MLESPPAEKTAKHAQGNEISSWRSTDWGAMTSHSCATVGAGTWCTHVPPGNCEEKLLGIIVLCLYSVGHSHQGAATPSEFFHSKDEQPSENVHMITKPNSLDFAVSFNPDRIWYDKGNTEALNLKLKLSNNLPHHLWTSVQVRC